MSAKNKAIIEKANDTFRRSDVEGLLALCTDDFTWTMVGAEPVTGKAAIREWMGKGPSEPPKFSIDTVIAEGDFVTCIGDMTMAEKGEVVPYGYCDVWRLAGDKIAELKTYVIKTKS
ncbi:MAG: nuclear transport factor 2 family protein [Vicinamibacterales bacterium]